jgi:putative protease
MIEVTFGRGAVNLAALAPGSIVWKTDDPAMRRRLEQSYARDLPPRRVALNLRVAAGVGKLLTIDVTDDAGHAVRVQWETPLEEARKHPLTVELIRAQWSRLGDTPFTLGAVEFADAPAAPAPTAIGVMAPKSVLNDLRHQAVKALLAQRAEREVRIDPHALDELRQQAAATGATRTSATAEPAFLYVLVRNLEQLDAALNWQPPAAAGAQVRRAMVYCDFEDVRRYGEAVAQARAAGVPIGLATLRVFRPGEEGFLKIIAACRPDAVLVRNLAAVSYFMQQPERPVLIGDYALNVANELTAGILARAGLARLTPGYDLNWAQLAALLGRSDPALFEVVVHQHMPMFHMEHCVFAHTLSGGKDFHDCGRPCDRHRVDLRDRVGMSHPLVADAGCRNTLFNAQAQSAADCLPRMRDLGLRHFRVELLRHRAAEAAELLDRYARVLAGADGPRSAWQGLRVLHQLGVTRGTLEE